MVIGDLRQEEVNFNEKNVSNSNFDKYDMR